MSDSTDCPASPTSKILTPPGAGAVAVVQISDLPQDSAAHVLRNFAARQLLELSEVPVSRIIFGSWNAEDVVVVRISEFCWEIHCHGGSAAVQRIMNDLKSAGVHAEAPDSESDQDRADIGEFSAAVIRTAIACRTRKTAALSLAQLNGPLKGLLQEARSPHCPGHTAAISTLQIWQSVAEHLTRPWRIVFVGAPNVGKSSLLNTIAGLQRSIVSSIAGTTRDLVEVEVPIDGWMFQFVDTAGVRAADSSTLENLGIQQSLDVLESGDLICLILDVTQPSFEPRLMTQLKHSKRPVCILWNKCDLLGEPKVPSSEEFATPDFPVCVQHLVSAQTETGLAEFYRWLVKTLVPEEPGIDSPLPLPELKLSLQK